MTVWIATPVEDVPEIVLSRWSVRELPNGDRHLVGYNETEFEGRVSSQVEAFDVERRTARTRSGRIYKLEGPSGQEREAEYVWGRWCRMTGNDMKTVRKVPEVEVFGKTEPAIRP